jgi:hypothetical protein
VYLVAKEGGTEVWVLSIYSMVHEPWSGLAGRWSVQLVGCKCLPAEKKFWPREVGRNSLLVLCGQGRLLSNLRAPP